VRSGVFSPDEPDRYRDLVDDLTYHDHFLVTADFDSFAARQREVAELWLDRPRWWHASVMNTAKVGWFSSDRAIAEYSSNIWNATRVERS
jgi:starch phosphorylase